MKNKNILIIGNYPPPYGGVPHHIERLTEYLVDRGWICHVLSGGASGNEHIGGISVYKPKYARRLIGIIRQSLAQDFPSWLAEGLPNRVDRHIRKHYKVFVDIGEEIIEKNEIQLITSYNLLTSAPIGAWLAKKYGLPHVISIFGEIYKYESMSRNKPFFGRLTKSAFRLLSCSDHCGRSLKRIGVETPVYTVTYGVNIEHFTPGDDPVDLRSALGLRSSPVILFVGRLGREMGLDSFLVAARLTAERFPDVRFVMIGQADDLANEVEKECQLSKGRFVVMRNVPYVDLPNYYRLATIMVVPTRGDRTCSSLAAMEAMATRKPVIGFAIGGIPEIVEHEKTGLLVEPENTQALADAIGRLLEDDTLRNKLAEAGYQQSQARFCEKLVNVTMERHFLDALATA